jgi:hypothetical protein
VIEGCGKKIYGQDDGDDLQLQVLEIPLES